MMELLKRMFSILVLFIVVFVFFIYFALQLIAYPETKFSDFKTRNITNAAKVILFWNGFFSTPNWELPSIPSKLQIGNEECIFTNNHNYLPRLEQFDALLFHAAVSFEHPAQRDPKQQYVFALKEAPPHTHHSLDQEENFYNLTMTYRLDSDVFWPYSYIVDAKTGQRVAPTQYPHWKNSSFFEEFVPSNGLLQHLKRKRKSIAWFVSNCKTFSKREKLVKSLQKYIQVDIYGSCGTLSCPRDNKKDCNEILDNDYKFYLSFENSLCIDYVTEKLFNALNRKVVPIVFGGANYDRFAPPHSYINVEDFKTVEVLANFLILLEKNIDEYAKYYWWKDFYLVKNDQDKNNIPATYYELCAKVHSTSATNGKGFYRNIEEYWYWRACRTESDIKFS